MEYGTAGTYFLKGPDWEIQVVFKPIDEEAFAPNNPKGNRGEFGSKTFRAGVLSGEGAIWEVAAYIMGGKFSHVPDTTLAEVIHPIFQHTLDTQTIIDDEGYSEDTKGDVGV